MGYRETLLGLLPPVSYNRTAPRIRAQAEIDGLGLDEIRFSASTVADAIHPVTAGDMLPDWERVLGLVSDSKTRQERILAVIAKFNETGGLSIPYFVRLARAAGYQIEISEPQPFRAGVNRVGDRIGSEDLIYIWRVNIKNGNNHIYQFRAGVSAAGERLSGYGDAFIERVVQDLKPAHTDVHFTYER